MFQLFLPVKLVQLLKRVMFRFLSDSPIMILMLMRIDYLFNINLHSVMCKAMQLFANLYLSILELIIIAYEGRGWSMAAKGTL